MTEKIPNPSSERQEIDLSPERKDQEPKIESRESILDNCMYLLDAISFSEAVRRMDKKDLNEIDGWVSRLREEIKKLTGK